MHRAEEAVVTLAHLDEIGVRLSIDDFGTGYSSLSVLKKGSSLRGPSPFR